MGGPDAEILQINKEKREALRKARRANFRQAVYEAKDKPGGIWNLARWGKERSHTPPEPPMVPTLAYTAGQDHEIRRATTFEEKVKVFSCQFFPPVLEGPLCIMPRVRMEYRTASFKQWGNCSCWHSKKSPRHAGTGNISHEHFA
jgi:hypothetical protein